MKQFETRREIWRLGRSFDNVAVIRRADLRPYEQPVNLLSSLTRQIERWLADPITRDGVLDLYKSVNGGGTNVTRSMTVPDLLRHVIPRLEDAFKRGDFVLLQGPRRNGGTLASVEVLAEELASRRSSEKASRLKETKHWIGFEVIDDDTEQPIEGVKLLIKLPDGSIKPFRTNSEGRIEIRNLDDGMCEAVCDLEGAGLEETYRFLGLF